MFFKFSLFITFLCLTNHNDAIAKIKGSGVLDFLFSPCRCRCGIPNRVARPLGGEYLRGYEFPWLAIIQIKNTRSIPGSLINDKYVLTAASPLQGLTPFDVKVTLGQYDRCFSDMTSLNISVESIIIHKEFNPGNTAHDLALIKLSTPVSFEKRISPICLATPSANYVGQVATIVGWSLDSSEFRDTCRPRKLGLPVLNHDDCLKMSQDTTQFVSVDKRCAGIIGAPSLVCKSDAGGPVMYRSYGGVYELIGTLSERNDCGAKHSMALYTTINDHLSWITSNTLDACYCLKTY